MAATYSREPLASTRVTRKTADAALLVTLPNRAVRYS